MGQIQNRQDTRHNPRASAQRKGLHRNIASLGLAIALAATAFAQRNPANWRSSSYKFDSKAAWSELVAQVDFGPRVPGTNAQIKCRDYLVSQLKKGCDDVRIQHLTHHWSRTNSDVDIYNVIGSQNWKDAKVRVVLLAHWDSRPEADGPNSPPEDQAKPIPGANDGASGAAVLIELAKALKDRHPGLGIMYLLDDGEDLGPEMKEMLLGVDYFVNNPPDPKPDYGILLDMIGKTGTRIPMEMESYARARKVEVAFFANANKMGLGSTFPMQYGDDMEDDHIPLLDKGIPTIDLIDFQYPQWHTVNDTPAYCSQESLQRVGVALESFLTQSPPFAP